MNTIPAVTTDELIARYDALLLDAYGVLVNKEGALPGAAELISKLNRLGKPYYLVSNTAGHLPENAAVRYRAFGLDLAPERILTAGLLIKPYFEAKGYQGLRCAVLGPEDSFIYAEDAGARPASPFEDFDLVLIGDQVGFPFLDGVDAVLSRLIAKLDRGETVPLILPNPDLIYPKSSGFGITSGTVALMIETVLRQRFPEREDVAFVRLGKPEPGIFVEAVRRLGTKNVVMIGDQVDTDIRGASGAGLDSALVAGGVSGATLAGGIMPTYRLESLF
ncbi:MAG: HAD-IA family hydrolase [Proteobacteria bacterium]|nr:HAD-IA family hydrolase [Pseudomonadota bacterium]